MQRIQTYSLLIAGLTAAIMTAGCGQEKSRTVAEYLHDIDAANAAAQRYSNDPGRYTGNPDWKNASTAIVKSQSLGECFPKILGERFTTANTNHACLDQKGYVR